jgi:hypothetical protein
MPSAAVPMWERCVGDWHRQHGHAATGHDTASRRGIARHCKLPAVKRVRYYVRCGSASQSWPCISSSREAVRSNIIAFSPRR